jgi:hypothetical protein
VWKHFFAACMSLNSSIMSSLRHAGLPFGRGSHKCRNKQEGNVHFGGSCPLRPPIATGMTQTNRGGLHAPSAVEKPTKKYKKPGNIARRRFGASWRCCWRSGAYLLLTSFAPAPRESLGTPWKVSAFQLQCKVVNGRHCTQCQQLN